MTETSRPADAGPEKSISQTWAGVGITWLHRQLGSVPNDRLDSSLHVHNLNDEAVATSEDELILQAHWQKRKKNFEKVTVIYFEFSTILHLHLEPRTCNKWCHDVWAAKKHSYLPMQTSRARGVKKTLRVNEFCERKKEPEIVKSHWPSFTCTHVFVLSFA